MTEQTTWDDLMKSTNASLRELDIAYSRMMRTAAAIKAGTGRLAARVAVGAEAAGELLGVQGP